MSKFEVEKTVWIKPFDLIVGKADRPGFQPSMSDYCGKKAEVFGFNDYYYKLDGLPGISTWV